MTVKLKWGHEYKKKGFLVLANIEEFIVGVCTGNLLGEVLVRCNNVLYIR